MKKKVAIICFTNFVTEPRVLRTIEALKNNYDIQMFSTGQTINGISCENVEHLNCDGPEISFHKQFPVLLKRVIAFFLKLIGYSFQSDAYFKRVYWSPQRKMLLQKVISGNFAIVIGHGIYTVPILAALNTKTIFNAHEYYLKEFEEKENWKKYTQPFYRYILDQYLSKIDCMFCVSKFIQDEYLQQYKVRSLVITNATAFCDLAPISVGHPVRIIHHGGAIRTRQLELMGEMMAYLNDNYSLTFMLTASDKEYLEELKSRFANDKRIHFIDPVPVYKIAETCNKFDIGLFILPPVNFNWYYALPNKLFEFIQGRLCIAVSPNPDMKRIVSDYDLGVVAEDYTSKTMAEKILALTAEKINYFKSKSNTCASVLNASKTQQLILTEINRLAG